MSEFLIDLGNGFYLDSGGNVVEPPFGWHDPHEAIYQTPGGEFPLPRDAWHGVATDMKEALRDLSDKNKGPGKFLSKHGVDDQTLEILSDAADLAGALATITGIAGFAFKALEMFEVLNFGPSALEALIERRFDELRQQVRALEEQNQARDLRNLLGKFTSASARAREYNESVVRYPRGDHTQPFNDLRNTRNELAETLALFLNSATWNASFQPDDYKDFDLAWLTAFPGVFVRAADETDHRIGFPPAYDNRFDHRLLVPAATYAVQSFLMVSRTVVPEFRSVGIYDEDIRPAARALMALTERMRNETLARTQFTADSFAGRVAGRGLFEFPAGPRVLLGAVDLCGSTKAALDTQREASMKGMAEAAGVPDQWPRFEPERYGTVRRAWAPPAQLDWKTGPRTSYEIVNKAECAEAANYESDLEYSRLLMFSGYLHLVQLTGLLRLHASEPDRSETVSGSTSARRRVTSTNVVTARSENILLTGVIESPAIRLTQEFRTTLAIQTQPVGRERPIPYRVAIRTLRSRSHEAIVDEWPYDLFHRVRYEPDPHEPDFNVLIATTDESVQLDTAPLTDWMESPATTRSDRGRASLSATSFDWYLPQRPLRQSVPGRLGSADPARAAGDPGGKQEGIGGSRSLARPFAELDMDFAGWLTWDPLPNMNEAHARNPREASIDVLWHLKWRGSRLRIDLEVGDTGGNCIVYVVVEERLNSGSVLHTAFRVPVGTALTYIPPEFFEAEAAAYAKLRTTLRDLADDLVLVGAPPPGSPQEAPLTPADLVTIEGSRRAFEQLATTKSRGVGRPRGQLKTRQR